MDDDEARYLTGQYNAYVSWRVGRGEVRLAEISTLLVVFAIVISIAPVVAPENSKYMIFVVYLGIAVGWFYVTAREAGRAKKQYKDFETRLIALEDYRRVHKSLPNMALPDDITFRLLVEKPEELNERLRIHWGEPPKET